MNLILASNSPRRKEILLKNGYEFNIIPSIYDEKISGLKYSSELVKNCAYNKALNVKKRITGDYTIVGADTVVVLDNIILGKPVDKPDAFKMLLNLSGKTHFVATAVCLITSNGVTVKDIELTYVTFRKLSYEEIFEYVNRANPLDKAGSYGIQDEGFDFASSVDGEIDNVIGFPIKLFKKMLSLI